MTKSPKAPVQRIVRCAVYTRKSTEEGLEQEFNSSLLDVLTQNGRISQPKPRSPSRIQTAESLVNSRLQKSPETRHFNNGFYARPALTLGFLHRPQLLYRVFRIAEAKAAPLQPFPRPNEGGNNDELQPTAQAWPRMGEECNPRQIGNHSDRCRISWLASRKRCPGESYEEGNGRRGLYADYISNKIWALRYDEAKRRIVANRRIRDPNVPVLSFGEDETGEVYFLTYTNSGRGIYWFANGRRDSDQPSGP
jgi:hypothetical protein